MLIIRVLIVIDTYNAIYIYIYKWKCMELVKIFSLNSNDVNYKRNNSYDKKKKCIIVY